MLREGYTYEEIILGMYKKISLDDAVKDEIQKFKDSKVRALVCSYNLTASISTRAVKIPYITIVSGTCIPPYYKAGFATFPDNYENSFTRLTPSFIKDRIATWILLRQKILTKEFNKISKKYGLKPFKNFNDLYLGDYSLVCDDIYFLGIDPTDEYPLDCFIGHIVGGDLFEQKPVDPEILDHINRPGRSILFIMGGTGRKSLFLKIIDALSKTDYNVIAVYTTILGEDEIPETSENVLLKKFIPSPIDVHEKVDLSIIHGGRGTVQTVACSGKPIIGIPMSTEHQYNIDNMVRHGAAVRISMKFFKEKELLYSIEKIFANYDKYLNNAKDLASKLPKGGGEEKAADRLIKILKN